MFHRPPSSNRPPSSASASSSSSAPGSAASFGIQRGFSKAKKTTSSLLSIKWIAWGSVSLGFLVYFFVLGTFLKDLHSDSRSSNGNARTVPQLTTGSTISQPTFQKESQTQRIQQEISNSGLKSYDYWKEVAITLAAMEPKDVLKTLETKDPFGVRQFEEQLVQAESEKGAILDLQEVRERLFPCPAVDYRITVPDQRNLTRLDAYHASRRLAAPSTKNFTFLFFQHLRKAGGTNFCTLAKENLPKSQVPTYYCMPDYEWSRVELHQRNPCAGCLTVYNNTAINYFMKRDDHRILGNEWHPFDPSRFFDLSAIFATSFRKPLDRALSQFRFECIEDRGCKIKNVTQWWDRRKDLTNVYTWTFSKQALRKISKGTAPEQVQKRKQVMATSLDTIAKFHLVLVMEWLAYAPALVQDVLDFPDTSSLTKRVRPHIGQYQRKDGQEENKLGAAGIAKASWTPKEYLSPEQYKVMSQDLALDEILTDAARRMFLERIVCS